MMSNNRPRRLLFLLLLCSTFRVALAEDSVAERPRALDPRLKIELFAEQPTIATPTGIDVDHAGRVWAIESNTHFPPEGYSRHPSDRIWVMQDTEGDGQADQVVEFADGLTHTMSIAVRPVWLDVRNQGRGTRDEPSNAQRRAPDGVLPPKNARESQSKIQVFVATRAAIFLLHDDDGDLHADRKETLIRLETPGNYPHNGLAGFAFDALGFLYFGFGENLGAEYKIIGSDGTTLSGGGEGGNLYRCRPDGSELKQWATGFWNPHASCVDAFGRLFTVDNDPDSRPPCRLLHIIPGGDYGFRFRNGRKGLHPFTSWNGEIPGTLPMVAGTGEAPSGIVAYESDGLPEEYLGDLLVTSWGDHRIDRFRLKPKGASFESLAETIIQGGEDFRPVGVAVAPDGSFFITDWVKRDYKLHGHGRVWRISMKEEPQRDVLDAASITAETPVEKLRELLKSPRLEVRRTAARLLRESGDGRDELGRTVGDFQATTRERIESLWGIATTPLAVCDFGILRDGQDSVRIAGNSDEVELATLDLIGTPQFPFDPQQVEFLSQAVERRLWRPQVEGAEPTPAHLASWRAKIINHLDLREALSTIGIAETDPFVLSAMRRRGASLTRAELIQSLIQLDGQTVVPLDPPRRRLLVALMGRSEHREFSLLAKLILQDPDSAVRRVGVQWAAEESLKELRPLIEDILDDPDITTDLFLATLAALEMLDGVPPQNFDKTPASKYVLPQLKDPKRSAAVRAQALRLVDPNDAELTTNLLAELVRADHPALQREAIRTLQQRTASETAALLREVAENKQAPIEFRAEAVAGLAIHLQDEQQGPASRRLLVELIQGENEPLRIEAVRSLRAVATADDSLKQTLRELRRAKGTSAALIEQIQFALAGGVEEAVSIDILNDSEAGDAEAGRRVFYHAHGAGCYKCHTVNGRGGNVGPDLSVIARTMDRRKLAESILDPSKEISPQYTAWTFVMESGQVHTGMLLGDTRNSIQQIGTPEGKVLDLKTNEIELRQPQEKSLMPADLVKRMTAQEFRDLLAFLETLK